MIQLNKSLYRVDTPKELDELVQISAALLYRASTLADETGINWLFEHAFVDTAAGKISALFHNALAPSDDQFTLTLIANQQMKNWHLSEHLVLPDGHRNQPLPDSLDSEQARS